MTGDRDREYVEALENAYGLLHYAAKDVAAELEVAGHGRFADRLREQARRAETYLEAVNERQERRDGDER